MRLKEKIFLSVSALLPLLLIGILVIGLRSGVNERGIFAEDTEKENEPELLMQEETAGSCDNLEETDKAVISQMMADVNKTKETFGGIPDETGNERGTPSMPPGLSAAIDISSLNHPDGASLSDEHDVVSFPYYIKIIRVLNCVTVFEMDEAGEYSMPLTAFACSTGGVTPKGIFDTKAIYEMKTLNGDVFGQYATWITGNILFHSVPSSRATKDSLVASYYNQRFGRYRHSVQSSSFPRLPVYRGTGS